MVNDLSTTYLGLKLRNPLIVGSSTHTRTLANVIALEEAGAGAVVLKSVFEEQIQAEVAGDYDALDGSMHPEAYQYLTADLPMQHGPDAYLDTLRDIKAAVSIPVIASVNCVGSERWLDFAHKLEVVGADALEINIYDIPDDPGISGSQVEERHAAIVRSVVPKVGIPVAVKLAPYYSSLINLTHRLANDGAGALVLFNRFFQPDIDVDELTTRNATNLSRSEDIRLPLRWIAMLSKALPCELCLTSGVHRAEDAVKALLAGAQAFQVCSTLYSRGNGAIPEILEGLASWMERHDFTTLTDFRGRLAQEAGEASRGYERAQYMKSFVGLE